MRPISTWRWPRWPGLYGEEVDVSVPAGFDFDDVDLDALEQRIGVANGVLTAGKTRYRVLYLGGSSARMTVRALRRLAVLVEEGATGVGRRPIGSPSLADDDAEHARLCDALWGTGTVVDDRPPLWNGWACGPRSSSTAPSCCGSVAGSAATTWCSSPTRCRSPSAEPSGRTGQAGSRSGIR
jgi:hypothetical protein